MRIEAGSWSSGIHCIGLALGSIFMAFLRLPVGFGPIAIKECVQTRPCVDIYWLARLSCSGLNLSGRVSAKNSFILERQLWYVPSAKYA